MSPSVHRRVTRLQRWIFALFVLLIVAILAAVIGWTRPAKAQQPNCDTYNAIAKHLSDKYHETRAATAVTANNVVMEILVSPAGTWTLIMVWPNGRACFYASGDGWQLAKERGTNERW